MFGGLSGIASGLAQTQGLERQEQHSLVIDSCVPVINYKPTIEAGDSVQKVLQSETDEWLKEIK